MRSVSPARAELIYVIVGNTVLSSFDSATPISQTSVPITGLQAGEAILGIDLRPATGQLYALGSTSRLYTINLATGAATQVGSAGAFTLSGTVFGFDFNPTVDRIRVVSDTGQNIRLNPNDGTLTATDTTLTYAAGDTNFGATPSDVGAAYVNNMAGAPSTTLGNTDSLGLAPRGARPGDRRDGLVPAPGFLGDRLRGIPAPAGTLDFGPQAGILSFFPYSLAFRTQFRARRGPTIHGEVGHRRAARRWVEQNERRDRNPFR